MRDFQFQLWHRKSLEVVTPIFTTGNKAEQTENQQLFFTDQGSEVVGQTATAKSEERGEYREL